MPDYHSQMDQDRLLDETIFCGMREGVFVDVGAYDGVIDSNTLMFERDRGWSGICVEANPALFSSLEANCTAKCVNLAVGAAEGVLPFVQVTGWDTFSGLADSMDPRHLGHIPQHIREKSGSITTIDITVTRLSKILSDHDLSEIHYLSVDTEGSEPDILSSVDFNSVMVHVATVEANYNDQRDRIESLMCPQFDLVGQHHNDLYLINRDSRFYQRRHMLRPRLLTPYQPLAVRRARRVIGRAIRHVYPHFRSAAQ